MNNSEPTPPTDGPKPAAPETTRLTRDVAALRVIGQANSLANGDDWPARILQSAFSLGLSKKKWSVARQRAIAEFGDYCTLRFVCATIQASSFKVLEEMETVIKELRLIVKKKQGDPVVRVDAAKALSATALAWQQISKHCVDIARIMSPKDSQKPRNLPPQMPVQINVSGQNAGVTIGREAAKDASQLTPTVKAD